MIENILQSIFPITIPDKFKVALILFHSVCMYNEKCGKVIQVVSCVVFLQTLNFTVSKSDMRYICVDGMP